MLFLLLVSIFSHPEGLIHLFLSCLLKPLEFDFILLFLLFHLFLLPLHFYVSELVKHFFFRSLFFLFDVPFSHEFDFAFFSLLFPTLFLCLAILILSHDCCQSFLQFFLFFQFFVLSLLFRGFPLFVQNFIETFGNILLYRLYFLPAYPSPTPRLRIDHFSFEFTAGSGPLR